MTPTMRPGRVADVPQIMDLWRHEVAMGRQDIVPSENRFRRMLSHFDWDLRSRVVEEAGRLTGAVLVTSRPSPAGVLANVYASGEDAVYADMARWGLLFSRANGAAIVQLYAGKGRGEELTAAGLRCVRPWWRMDRDVTPDLPPAQPVPGYDVIDARLPAPESWADLFNRTFADHWRFTPRSEVEIVGDKQPELCLMAVTAGGRDGVAMALTEIEEYGGDSRPQPVSVISSVGTLPKHRSRGLARLLVAELLIRSRRAGARSASLYVDGRNPTGAPQLYRNLGFEVTYEAEVWEATFP